MGFKQSIHLPSVLEKIPKTFKYVINGKKRVAAVRVAEKIATLFRSKLPNTNRPLNTCSKKRILKIYRDRGDTKQTTQTEMLASQELYNENTEQQDIIDRNLSIPRIGLTQDSDLLIQQASRLVGQSSIYIYIDEDEIEAEQIYNSVGELYN